ncbi:hypothetical protein K504DRAFT_483928 [Pleomassaria siparia CBS 279.74]|uniref:UbiA prenyltransferase n=1 Tax=Pleomassaria siparia CBS 279.74 TaxID=1314801 RepID=A0A6G1JZZ2_9PLEO|nr:hypothetical protein K504DRAFT_483928 [Pleomassaria siparia CBS 279.74]
MSSAYTISYDIQYRAMDSTVDALAELMRLHRPVGILNIFFPYMYGFFYTILVTYPKPSLYKTFFVQFPLLFFSTFVLRSVGCIWNDIVDADIDKHVARTRTRPLPRGAISPDVAYFFALALLAIWTRLSVYEVPLTAIVVAYPYIKRITNYAQVWLSLTLAWGTLFGAAIAGFDVLAHVSANISQPSALLEPRICGLAALYLVYVTWSVIHDTIYAFQDYKDDKLIDKALWLLSHTQVLLLVIACMTMGPELQGLPPASARSLRDVLALAFIALQYRWIFVLVAVLGNVVSLSLIVGKVDLGDSKSCAWYFKNGSIAVGSSIGLGFLLEFLVW